MRILSFGHLPISYGGKQTSGASFVIYQLAKHFNELDNIDSFVCATDIYNETGVGCDNMTCLIIQFKK